MILRNKYQYADKLTITDPNGVISAYKNWT